jgi:probable HAF family extracellular repeat protein
MKNIGGLGGHFTAPRSFNNRGEIVGISNLKNDPAFPHAFLWNGNSVRDLGTLGGECQQPNSLPTMA